MKDFPIVFLDIDGVLNTSKNYREWSQAMHAAGKQVGFETAPDDSFVELLFDSEPVENLNLIIQLTGAKIVVSSTWRLLYSDFGILVGILRKVGVEGDILDRTPSHSRVSNVRGERGDEVATWREENSHTGPFVCLDDDGDFQAVNSNLVQTDYMVGLSEADAFESVKLLKRMK